MNEEILLDERGWYKKGFGDVRYNTPYRPPAPIRRYSGPAPSTRHLSNRSEYGAYNKSLRRRPPVLDMKSDGSFRELKYGKGKSLPGYDPRKTRVKIQMPSRQSLVKTLAHLGLRVALRGNPYVNAADIAFNIAYDMYTGSQWGFTQPEIPEVKEAFYALNADEEYHCNAVPGTFTGWNAWSSGPPINNVYKCLVGQPPRGEWAGYERFGWPNSKTSHMMAVGPANYIGTGSRMTYANIFAWKSSTVAKDMYVYRRAPVPGVPARAGILPLSAPPVPVMSVVDAYDPPYRSLPRVNYRRGESPAVDFWYETATASAGGSRRMPPRVSVHVAEPDPPGTRTRKKKMRLHMALKVIAKLYDAATEAKEIVDILFSAIPRKIRRKFHGKGMNDKAYFVWQHMDDIDLSKAIGGILYNHYEDKIYGRVYGTVGEHTKYGSMMWSGMVPDVKVKVKRKE